MKKNVFTNLQHILKTVIVLYMLSFSMPTLAYDLFFDGIYYNKLSDNTLEVTNNTSSEIFKYSGNITIPYKFTDNNTTYYVLQIGEAAFKDCIDVTSVIISNGIVSISENAFSGCINLSSAEVPNSIKTIGENAFSGCSSLKTVEISSSVKSINNNTFYGCKSLKTIEIPGSVKSIGNNAFYGCTNLASTIINDGVEIIGDKAFYQCSELTTLSLPNSITTIGVSAFEGCAKFLTVDMPDNLTTVGKDAFYECTELNKVTIHDLAKWCNVSFTNSWSNPVVSAHHLYLDNEEITKLVIPDGVTSIGSQAFRGCSEINELVIPNSVTTIYLEAFSYCSGLTSLSIPESVTTIEKNVFYGCTGLVSVEIPGTLTTINQGLFAYCDGLTSVKIQKGITSIGVNAFIGCKALTTVEIPNTISSISKNAFGNCEYLKNFYCNSIDVPSTDASAFNGCYLNYATLHVPEESLSKYKSASVWKQFGKFNGFPLLHEYVFWCSDIKTLYFLSSYDVYNEWDKYKENTINKIWKGDDVIASNESGIPAWNTTVRKTVTNVVIEESFAEVKPVSFYGWFNDCINLTTIDGLKNLNTSEAKTIKHIFYNCSSLKSVDLSGFKTSNVINMNGVFYNCKSLTEIDLSSFDTKNVESMINMFYNCTGLTSLDLNNFYDYKTIHEGNMSYGCHKAGMFYGCGRLKTIYCAESWTALQSDNMFTGCTNLVGGQGFVYNSSFVNVDYANPGERGYFTDDSPYLVKSIKLDKHELSLDKGNSQTLQVTIIPESAKNKTIIWSSSDINIATVTQNGEVTAIKSGKTYIYVKLESDVSIKDSCLVIVNPLVKSVEISKKGLSLSKGESVKLEVSLSPEDADNKKVIWSSSDASVATVDESGTVTAVNSGEAWIKAVSDDNPEACDSCKVTVTQAVTGIELDITECTLNKIGQTIQLTAKVLPENATNKNVNWKSSNENVCFVSNGKVVAVGFGTAVVIATTEEGGYMAICTVKVEEASTLKGDVNTDGKWISPMSLQSSTRWLVTPLSKPHPM